MLDKVVIPMVASPIIGLLLGYVVMLGLMWGFRAPRWHTASRGFRHAQRFGEKGDQRLVRLVVFGHGADARLQLSLVIQSIDRVAAAIRGQPHRQPDMTVMNGPGGAHATSGKMVFHMKERRKKIISSRMIGEMSMPPRLGSTRRIGRSTGSVTL